MSDIRQRKAGDAGLKDALPSFFGEAFDDPASYAAKRPSVACPRTLLGGAWVIFVQADPRPGDEPAIALYTNNLSQ